MTLRVPPSPTTPLQSERYVNDVNVAVTIYYQPSSAFVTLSTLDQYVSTSDLRPSGTQGYTSIMAPFFATRPLINMLSLDKDILNNYRPVSSLPYMSKTIERVVAASIISASPISLRTSQITASRRPLSAYRMTLFVQRTTRTLPSCCF